MTLGMREFDSVLRQLCACHCFWGPTVIMHFNAFQNPEIIRLNDFKTDINLKQRAFCRNQSILYRLEYGGQTTFNVVTMWRSILHIPVGGCSGMWEWDGKGPSHLYWAPGALLPFVISLDLQLCIRMFNQTWPPFYEGEQDFRVLWKTPGVLSTPALFLKPYWLRLPGFAFSLITLGQKLKSLARCGSSLLSHQISLPVLPRESTVVSFILRGSMCSKPASGNHK